MNAILKILVFLTIFTGVYAQDVVERIPSSMEHSDIKIIDSSIEEIYIPYNQQELYGLSLVNFNTNGMGGTAPKISFIKETDYRFEWNTNLSIYAPFNENGFEFGAVVATAGAKVKPVISDYMDVFMSFEGGFGYVGYGLQTTTALFVGTHAGICIKISPEIKLNIESGMLFSPDFLNLSQVSIGLSINSSQF